MPPSRTRRHPPNHLSPSRARWLRNALIFLPLLTIAYLGFAYLTLPDPGELVKKTPSHSALMRARVEDALDDGKPLKLRHDFVPLAQISGNLQRAVVLGEDASFWMHDGIDWGETRKAVADAFAAGQLGRGASTITQQLAKNLYLSGDRSLVRKAKEWIIADRLEEKLTKKRILELYLNFAEWGEGIFGAQAAAHAYFGKSASQLDAAEAAILTAMLPAPRLRHPGKPSPNLVRRAYKIADLLSSVGLTRSADVRARLASLIGPDARKSKSK